MINKLLEQYNFQHAGEIKNRVVNGHPVPIFELTEDFNKGVCSKKQGWVYLWVLIDNKNIQKICYVGKAGKTLKERCNQHQAGARQAPSGSKKGRENANKISRFLKNHRKGSVKVYVRKSPTKKVLGEDVNFCEIEEKAIIEKCKKFSALWNKL